MTHVIDHWVNKEDKQYAQSTAQTLRVFGYKVMETKYHGNVLVVHTDVDGEFELGTEKVQKLFKRHKCWYTMTCYPAIHYKLRPELAESLRILFPNIDEPILVNPVTYYPEIEIGY